MSKLWFFKLATAIAILCHIFSFHMYSFLFPRPKECKTTSPVSYVFVDSAMSSSYIKDDTDPQLSQTPYDQDQLPYTSSAGNTPMSQSGSLSSGNSSQYSSGYYSDSSNSESVTSKSSRLLHPIVAYKHTGGQGLHDNSTFKKPSVASSLPIQSTPPTICDDKSSSSTSSGQASLENGSSQKKSASPYGSNKNTSLWLQKHSLPLQSSSAKMSMIPKPSSNRPVTNHSTSPGYNPSHKGHPSTTSHSTLQLRLASSYLHLRHLMTN